MLNHVSTTVFPNAPYAEKQSSLCIEFTQYFSDFEVQEGNFKLFYNSFSIDIETASVHLQIELIEL